MALQLKRKSPPISDSSRCTTMHVALATNGGFGFLLFYCVNNIKELVAKGVKMLHHLIIQFSHLYHLKKVFAPIFAGRRIT